MLKQVGATAAKEQGEIKKKGKEGKMQQH